MKAVSVSSLLSKKYGGKWKWTRHEWHCDDGVRYVCNVLTGKDFEGEYTGETSKCLYYKDNSKSPEWVYL